MWFQTFVILCFFIAHLGASTALKLDHFKPQRFQNVRSKFKLLCQLIEGSGGELHFKWYKNGVPLRSTDHGHRLKIDHNQDESTLIIDQLVATDSGNYSCEVENNGEGQKGDATFTVLTVKGL